MDDRQRREVEEAVSSHTGFAIFGAVALVGMALGGTLGGLPGIITFGIFFAVCALACKAAVKRATQ